MFSCLALLASFAPAGDWTALEAPALCAPPAPSSEPGALLDGIHVLLRPRGNDEQELFITELASSDHSAFPNVKPDEIRSELHRRIVSILSMLLLPFLALPFAIGRARSPRAYRIAIALGLLVAYYEIIQQGALATRTSGFSPWVTQWLPLALLAAFSLWRFYVVSFRLGGEGLDRWLVPLQEFASRLTTRFLALFGIRRGEA